jgi:hypothetical protein
MNMAEGWTFWAPLSAVFAAAHAAVPGVTLK